MKLSEFLANAYQNERTLKPESVRQLKMSVALFERQFPNVTLANLTHAELNQLAADNPYGWSPKTMRRRVADILGVWQYAFDVGESCREPMRRRVRRIHVPKRIPDAWSLEDLRRMLAACEHEQFGEYMRNGVLLGDAIYAVICVGFYTALRADDLLALRRDELSPRGVPIGQAKKRGDEVIVRVPQWFIEWTERHYPATVALAVAWPYSRPTLYSHWKRMLRIACLSASSRDGLQKLRRTAVSHGEAARLGYGATLAGHAPGSAVTARSYVDPRIVEDARDDAALPDIRNPGERDAEILHGIDLLPNVLKFPEGA